MKVSRERVRFMLENVLVLIVVNVLMVGVEVRNGMLRGRRKWLFCGNREFVS